MEKIFVYDQKKDKSVCAGYVINNNFVRKVDPKKHWLKIIDGYAIQSYAFNILYERKINDILFIEPKRVLKCSVNTMFEFGNDIDLGHGLQRGINKKYLKIEDKKQLQLL